MPRVNIRIHRFTLVAAFFFSPYPRSKFFRHPKVWADTLLIRVQSMKLRNGFASVTNPKGKGQFDLMEQRVECSWPKGQNVCVGGDQSLLPAFVLVDTVAFFYQLAF